MAGAYWGDRGVVLVWLCKLSVGGASAKISSIQLACHQNKFPLHFDRNMHRQKCGLRLPPRSQLRTRRYAGIPKLIMVCAICCIRRWGNNALMAARNFKSYVDFASIATKSSNSLIPSKLTFDVLPSVVLYIVIVTKRRFTGLILFKGYVGTLEVQRLLVSCCLFTLGRVRKSGIFLPPAMALDSPTVIARNVQASRYIDIIALVVCGRRNDLNMCC